MKLLEERSKVISPVSLDRKAGIVPYIPVPAGGVKKAWATTRYAGPRYAPDTPQSRRMGVGTLKRMKGGSRLSSVCIPF